MSDDIGTKVALLEERVRTLESNLQGGTCTTRQAMARLGYKCDDRFWQAVRRLGIPFSRLSPKHAMFRTSDIDAALQRRQVGSGRARRTAL